MCAHLRFIAIKMRVFSIIATVDPNLGRLDYSLLSDQALMEMLFDGFYGKTKEKYQDNHSMYLDVCEWSCVKCDEDERVIEIKADSYHVISPCALFSIPPKVRVLIIYSWSGTGKLTGSVDLTHLPDGMEHLSLHHNQLTGEVDLTYLPGGLQNLYLDNNLLTGKIDLTKLPEGMQELDLRNNQFTGEVDLTYLPEEVQELHLSNNLFTGKIDLIELPEAMRVLDLRNNQFTGEIDVTQLPDKMEFLLLDNNRLSGSLLINRIPRTMTTIDVGRNRFNAAAMVDPKEGTFIKLRESGVTSVVDENGKEFDMKRFFE